MEKSIEQQSKNNKTMKVNIENLRQSVMMPTKEDRADWTNGLYLIYEDGHAEPFTGDNFKDCVRYIGLKHKTYRLPSR